MQVENTPPMEPLVLTEFSSLGDIEQALRAIADASPDGLQLTKQSINKRHGALHDTARLQALVTWARIAKHPYLQFHASNPVDSVLPELADYAPGIAAMRLAQEVRIGSHVIPRREALDAAISKMLSTDSFDLPHMIGGRSIDMTCVSGARVQYLRPLFSARRAQSVKRSDEMYQMLRKLNDYINKHEANLVPDSLLRALGIFVNELFSNTQEHAVSDDRGIPYAAHCEGMVISWNQLDESTHASDFSGHPRLQRFWDHESTQAHNSEARTLRCLQLSFFDSGPGLAARAAKLPTLELDLDVERDWLLKCLRKNTTSKKQAGAGHGLPAVLMELSRSGGLIRIRSGRHALFNVFDGETASDLFDFADWRHENLAPAAGAVVSLIIPLRRAIP